MVWGEHGMKAAPCGGEEAESWDDAILTLVFRLVGKEDSPMA